MDIINNFNPTDWVIVAVFAISIIFGLFRGLIKEAGTLVIWIGAFVLAFMFYDQFSDYLSDYIENELIRQVASAIILILAVIFVGGLLNIFLGWIVHLSGLGGIDKMFGAVFGFLRAGILAGFIAHLALFTQFSQSEYYKDSVLTNMLQPYGEWVYNLIPENTRTQIQDWIEKNAMLSGNKANIATKDTMQNGKTIEADGTATTTVDTATATEVKPRQPINSATESTSSIFDTPATSN